ncbi:polyribonucleotide 5-hydroxyl-kinase clp1 [Stylonychia lemnae]|uniref:Polyribonucleotide 5-hydroxyl-kinase clp1 n=1 Tax=Stylonychia lemnae TaxID=5949 RepID=A0A078A6H5_STYLE|nr:polyribonucleotide 5-hydroxyl-kinase clp1 [Stylonychia lemnae]|eukprot:CDW77180.1 polyribonucleotide 5-hydroxyl-kinase clp1 [Stylonychia lemnae]
MPEPSKTEVLQGGFELRIYSIEDHIKVMLLEGRAEVFGKELPLEEPVFFHQGEKLAIFSWHSAKVQVSGKCDCYQSSLTPMYQYVNCHSALNQLRQNALKNLQLGPSLLVTGSNQSGKSTLCRILINYSLKLGWTPLFVDLDLANNEITPPGSISCTMVEEPLPNDELIQQAVSFFQGSCPQAITQEFFDRQIKELANAVHNKLNSDLMQFKADHQLETTGNELDEKIEDSQTDSQKQISELKELQKLVSPPYPELFASGCIINGYTPQDKRDTETLIEAIKAFNVGTVLVVDNERLENEIRNALARDATRQNKPLLTNIIPLQKSGGVQSMKFEDRVIFEKYQEYFRGKYYASFSRRDQNRLSELGPEALMSRNEYDPQDMKLSLEEYKFFQVEGKEIPITALPAGATSPRWSTLLEEVKVQSADFANLKHRILALLVPQDVQKLRQLEREMALYPSNNNLKEEFRDLLMKSSTAGLMQITDYHPEERQLEVRTITNEQMPSNYLLISKFKLPRIV